ncbi:MAG: glycosyl transferase family protein [Acidobacteria bacterium OLB17]|nr:MAG: glycosyl transferase family protein [Acidobacteria bacterium OLB17]MCZ2390168.1 glycosyltransferase [Acidobacteriota bacterium]
MKSADNKIRKPRHLLTVLVEDYFHVGAFETLIQQRNWENFEPRYEQNTLKTLDLLDEFDTKATFFILGWIAEQNADLVREIAARGHEVASRGYYHRSVRQLSPEEFRDDIARATDVLSDASGQRIVGYRAAEKLNYERDGWIVTPLSDAGYKYDASFLPTRSSRAEQRVAHRMDAGDGIWEFPYSTRNMGVGLLPISGGNYFRQIPYTLMRFAVRAWGETTEEPFVSYFHVWELDPEQPRISAASKYNRIRHYRKLDKMEWILRENLSAYDCVSIADHLGLGERSLRAEQAEAAEEISVVPATRTRDLTPITIGIPCYNETEALPYLANTLRSVERTLTDAGYSANFIFVDDHSKDNTLELLHELFDGRPNTRIISHEQNLGVAAAIMTAIKAAETEIVASMDCDCTYDPHELARMLPLLEKDCALVTASPYHKQGGVRNVPGWRLFLSKGASALYRAVLNQKLATYTSCFRVYRRSSFEGLEIDESGFLGVAEMLGRIDLDGGRIVEFPAVLEVRLFGFSKMKTAATIVGHLKLLAKLAKLRFFRKSAAIRPSIALEEETR